MKPMTIAPSLSALTVAMRGRLHAQQDIGAAARMRGGVAQFGVAIGCVGKVGRGPGAALNQYACAQRLQFARDFGNQSNAGFAGGGLLQDSHDDRHAEYLPKR